MFVKYLLYPRDRGKCLSYISLVFGCLFVCFVIIYVIEEYLVEYFIKI